MARFGYGKKGFTKGARASGIMQQRPCEEVSDLKGTVTQL
ncbi:hypothetical protein COLO4_07570 [Corchorus olitorius]|uniref:Uncharacterized protein n=1 Tax=Corchorus olitorius TaxID=93759 RepID=A0A1R3KJD8_9ROSI|nr:hypothetical protein COLO4_07570 [Corchorus olitorius]